MPAMNIKQRLWLLVITVLSLGLFASGILFSYYLVLPLGLAFFTGFDAQIFSILGNVEKVLQMLNYAVLAMALLIIAGSLYWFSLCSAHQQAIIRAMRGTTSQVVSLYFRLGMCLVCRGLAGGLILGHGLYYCLSSLLQSRAGLYLPQQLAAEEGVLVVGVLLLGALCSWLPAYLTALRSDIVENL